MSIADARHQRDRLGRPHAVILGQQRNRAEQYERNDMCFHTASSGGNRSYLADQRILQPLGIIMPTAGRCALTSPQNATFGMWEWGVR